MPTVNIIGSSSLSREYRETHPFGTASSCSPLTIPTESFSTASRDVSAPWQQIVDELLRIRMLPNDWDGLGAFAPDQCLVDSSIKVVQKLKQVPGLSTADRVFLGVNGQVTFEWYFPDAYLNVEVISPNKAECSLLRQGASKAIVSRFEFT